MLERLVEAGNTTLAVFITPAIRRASPVRNSDGRQLSPDWNAHNHFKIVAYCEEDRK